ncbi:MAG: methyltransferase [Alphaproteobacteria bacterium]|nr:methyltransferase [Alphaproteobacteria bacterium]MBL7099354.1 methyltransferase [Alphaproteobacteria bacterium]
MNPTDFVRNNTQLVSPPLVPEIRLHLATEVLPLWRLTEEELEQQGVPPPYWAFAWAGGQALARYLIDNPETARGSAVLDFGAGSGLVAIAATMCGASALAADIDKFATAATALNAAANGFEGLETTNDDLIGSDIGWDVILVGDMCYERPLAERLIAWLRRAVTEGKTVLLGDPGRSYFPKEGLEKLVGYGVAVSRDLEDREVRDTGVYRLLP